MAARFEERIVGDPSLRYKTWVETVIEPRLLDKGVVRSERLSDWEFTFGWSSITPRWCREKPRRSAKSGRKCAFA